MIVTWPPPDRRLIAFTFHHLFFRSPSPQNFFPVVFASVPFGLHASIIPLSYHLDIPLSTSFLHLLSLSSSPSLVQYRSHSSRPLLPCVASAPLLPRFRAFLDLSRALIYTSNSLTPKTHHTQSSLSAVAHNPRTRSSHPVAARRIPPHSQPSLSVAARLVPPSSPLLPSSHLLAIPRVLST